MNILLTMIACGSENLISDPNAECETSDIENGDITYELSCPEIPACPSINLSCPEVIIPEFPSIEFTCPEPIVTVEAPTVYNESPDITVEPSRCNNNYTATCECPEIEIPECPSLDNVTIEVTGEVTLDGADFLTEFTTLINNPQDLVFYMESEHRGTGSYILFENTDTRDFVLTGVRLIEIGWNCSFDMYMNGDPTQDLTFMMPGNNNHANRLVDSLLGSNNGTIPMLPGDTIDLDVNNCGAATDEYRFAMMGYYQ